VKIAILTEYFYPDNSGGTPTDLTDLSVALKASYPDLSIDIITSRNLYRTPIPPSGLAPAEYWSGLNIKRLKVPKSNRPSMILRLLCGAVFGAAVLCELFTRSRYDLVFVVTNPPALAGAVWLHYIIKRVPYVYLVHDLYPDIAVALNRLTSNSLAAIFFKVVQRSWLIGASQVVVLGRCMRDHLVERYRIPDCAIVVIPSWGASLGAINSSSTNSFKRDLNHFGLVVLYAGNLSEYVKIERLIGAASILTDRPDILFVLVGDGAHRPTIQRAVQKFALNNVRLLPSVPRDQMPEVLSGCDIAFVSLDERMLGLGVPSKLYTILAAGKAVLATAHWKSEVARVLCEEECGINVISASEQDIAVAILKLADNSAQRRQYGENANNAAINKYSLEIACAKYNNVFRNCFFLGRFRYPT